MSAFNHAPAVVNVKHVPGCFMSAVVGGWRFGRRAAGGPPGQGGGSEERGEGWVCGGGGGGGGGLH